MTDALSRRRFLAGVGASTAVAATGVPASAADGSPPVATQSGIGSTLDELVPASLESHDIPGATVAVVDGDETITAGYGVADRESETPVDPAETAFRLGSVSKSVTATAIMEQIQRGELDPQYLLTNYVADDIVPDRQVSLAELLTHRGGFESSNRGLWLPDGDRIRPLAAYLRDEPQTQVRDPGTVGSYSNFGYSLAGQALAAVVGKPFHRAMDQTLLNPAGMTNSSFRQPLPDSVAATHATGHSPTGDYRNGQFPLVGLRPAGSLSATADDVARFLRLHLDDGKLDGEQVVEPDTAAATHEQWATHDERLDGMAFGLIEETRGETRTLWHNGATPSFYSHLVLVPEQEFGLFVSFNAPAGSAAANEVVEGVLDEMLPDSAQESPSLDGTPTRADELEGIYRSLRQSHTWHDRATSVLNASTVSVSVADDGALVTEGGGETNRWIEIEPLVFEHETGRRRIAFGEDDGSVEYLFRGGSPTAYGRVGGLEQLWIHGVLALVALLGAFSGVVGWPGEALYRRIRAEEMGQAGDVTWESLLGSRPARAKVVAGVAVAGGLGGLVAMLLHLAVSPYLVLSDPPVTFRALFAGPIVAVVATAGAVGYTGLMLTSGDGERLERVHYAAVTASLAVGCWLLSYWNLLFPPA